MKKKYAAKPLTEAQKKNDWDSVVKECGLIGPPYKIKEATKTNFMNWVSMDKNKGV